MRNFKIRSVLFVFSVMALSACAQNTKSMMNTSRVEVKKQTMMDQVPVSQINDVILSSLASDYKKLGSGPLELTMVFDPKSKTFTAMSALKKLKEVKYKLTRKGVKTVVTETLAVDKAQPSMMISFDSVSAQAPSDCILMPGLSDSETTRSIGEYKFGCSIETMLAKQIAKPADLEGVEGLDNASGGRREANIVETYASGAPRDPLTLIDRSSIGSK